MVKPPKIFSILILVSLLASPAGLHAELPQAAVVTAGSAVLDYSQAGVLNINVGSSQNIANWQSYSVGVDNTVNYNRDSAFSFLNRVIGSDPSRIFGAINAPNGKIFLINQNGILFAPGASVNAAGLIASTLDIRDADFLAGRFTFFGKGGSIVNQGYISAPGGFVALLAAAVGNDGVIEASLGSVVLAGGELMTLNLDPQGIISVVIDEATTQNLDQQDAAVYNKGKVSAEGGKVILTAKTLDGIFKKAVNNEGIIEAKSLVNKKGEVYLLGGMDDDLVVNSGTIDVSASDPGVDGGFVEISGAKVGIGGIIDVTSDNGDAGQLLIDPWDLTIGVDVLPLTTTDSIPAGENPYVDSVIPANWLEDFDGNVTIQALNDINFLESLNLTKINSGETFTAQAGRNIELNGHSVSTDGGNIVMDADIDFWYKDGSTYPKQWTNTADGIGSIILDGGSLTSNGGNITLRAGGSIGGGTIDAETLVFTLTPDFFFEYDAQETTTDFAGGYIWEIYWSEIEGGGWYYGPVWHDPEIVLGAPGRSQDNPDPTNYLAIDPRIRNIYHPMFRTVIIDRQTPTGTYFYHPLVLSDSSAFDEIALNAGAYDFIDGNLGLKGDHTFSPFYQEEELKNKNKQKS